MLENISSRNAGIDFLRGLAILLVLLLHFSLGLGLKDSPLGSLLGPDLLRAIVLNGNYGVTIFFTISGYLITSNSVKRWGSLAKINWREFYLLRIARIMPPLLLALLIIVTLGILGVPNFDNADNGNQLPASYFFIAAGSVLTFWHNVLMQSAGYFNYCLNIYWSLSVEEMFYLCLPLLCIVLRKQSLFILLCLALIVYAPIYRSQHLKNEIEYMYAYFACFDAIAIGCLTALLARKIELSKTLTICLRWFSMLALAIVYLRGIGGHEIEGFTLISLCSAVFLMATIRSSQQGWASRKGLVWLGWMGRHSYELYLFHIIVLALMRNVVSKKTLSYEMRLPCLFLFLLLSAVLAGLVARYVAEPANTYLRNKTRSLRTSLQVAQ
ncbi:acyltransferase family protein [Undibacterium sp. Ji83W]|uniref:acyltransferase family protein n=1 Tax=Undibacterium sp. Ji83W TaxID=3413043 RepID=UPI003BF3934C